MTCPSPLFYWTDGPLYVAVNGTGEIGASENTTFSCSADSQPPATFSWSFNDKETAVTGPVYNIWDSKVEQSGNYTCTASNNVTGRKVSATLALTVKGEFGIIQIHQCSDGWFHCTCHSS